MQGGSLGVQGGSGSCLGVLGEPGSSLGVLGECQAALGKGPVGGLGLPALAGGCVCSGAAEVAEAPLCPAHNDAELELLTEIGFGTTR